MATATLTDTNTSSFVLTSSSTVHSPACALPSSSAIGTSATHCSSIVATATTGQQEGERRQIRSQTVQRTPDAIRKRRRKRALPCHSSPLSNSRPRRKSHAHVGAGLNLQPIAETTLNNKTKEKESNSDSSNSSSSRSSVMFNIKILIVCILISFLNESSSSSSTSFLQQGVEGTHNTYTKKAYSNQFKWEDYYLKLQPQIFPPNMVNIYSIDNNDINKDPSSSFTMSQMDIGTQTQTQPQHILNETTSINNEHDDMYIRNIERGMNDNNSAFRNHSIFWPYTFLDSSSSSPSSSSLLSLQNQLQSFYNQSSSQMISQHPPLPYLYDITKSTEDNYKKSHFIHHNQDQEESQQSQSEGQNYDQFYGRYKQIRASLDYDYHSNYIPSRQLVQDEIIQYILSKNNCCPISKSSTSTSSSQQQQKTQRKSPWIIFTAGAMGAGKSYSIRYLHSKNRFPLSNFITIDPDEIRHLLPEYQFYIQQTNNTSMMEYAGAYTKKESGYICEILVQIALQNGCNVLMDGSLRDYKWYIGHFQSLRDQFKTYNDGTNGINIGIIHVLAPKDSILERARIRSKITKRIVPTHVLEESIEMVPKSVKILSQHVDFFVELFNGPNIPDIQIRTDGVTWDTFQQVFYDEEDNNDFTSISKTSLSSNNSMDDSSKSTTATTTTTKETKVSLSLHPANDQDENNIGSKKSLSSVTINAGFKVDKELDYQLLRLLSKL